MSDDRRIVRAVRVGTETVTDPDKLDRMATPQEIKRLLAKGHITGPFKGTAKVEESKGEKK
jgi:hypothetical protein